MKVLDHQSYLTRKVVVVAPLLACLLWGLGFLINSITRFVEVKNQHHYEVAPPLLSSALVLPDDEPYMSNGLKNLNFEAVREGKFRASYDRIQWIKEPSSVTNDKGTYVYEEGSKYVIRSVIDDEYEYVLYNSSSFGYNGIEYDIDDLVASPDLQRAVLKTNTTKSWRHSSFALYWLLDVQKHTIEPVYNTDDKVSVTVWSPASTHVAFVYENNVFVKKVGGSVTQVTFDGSENIFYGKPDWVYEEEVFSDDKALWWSPDGQKVAFLKTNDTLVPEFVIPYYVQPGYDDYPKIVKIKYPKAGHTNPEVDLVIYELADEVSGQDIKMSVSEFTESKIGDRLITEVVWVSNDNLLAKTSNRASDLLEVYIIDAANNTPQLVRTHEAKDLWFEVTSNTLYVPKNESAGRPDDGYIDTVVVDGYNHLAYFSPVTSGEGRLLTKGQWEVIGGVRSFNYLTNEVYFVSTLKLSVERHIHQVNLIDQTIQNVTNTLVEAWYSGTFSSGLRYLLLNYGGPDVPYQELVDLQTKEVIRKLQQNNHVRDNLEKYNVPETRYLQVELGQDASTGETLVANAVETLPLNFDPKAKYPVLFFVYGGPGSQLVTKSFSVSFSTVVAAELNAVVVTVDGRGTGYNNLHRKLGSNYKFVVRDQLGHYEPIDQIAAAKVWRSKSYVDQDRIAIWGWSYGGFLTLKTLEVDTHHVFSYGVLVAPVTKWRLYDSIYTERYLRTPQENPVGYETASIHDVLNFHDVQRFLIMHGSGDDNVHFQNSLKLLDEFTLAGVENFDFLVFPDSDHSISYHNANTVVYDRILGWLRKAFSFEFVN